MLTHTRFIIYSLFFIIKTLLIRPFIFSVQISKFKARINSYCKIYLVFNNFDFEIVNCSSIFLKVLFLGSSQKKKHIWKNFYPCSKLSKNKLMKKKLNRPIALFHEQFHDVSSSLTQHLSKPVEFFGNQ